MEALGEHLALALPQLVQSPRNHHAQTSHAARERISVACFTQVMQVIRLHAEVHDRKSISLRRVGDGAEHDLEFGPLPQARQVCAQALGHEQRMTRWRRAALRVRRTSDSAFGFAPCALTRATVVRELEFALPRLALASHLFLLHFDLLSSLFKDSAVAHRNRFECLHADRARTRELKNTVE
jgi:hypothetical protein